MFNWLYCLFHYSWNFMRHWAKVNLLFKVLLVFFGNSEFWCNLSTHFLQMFLFIPFLSSIVFSLNVICKERDSFPDERINEFVREMGFYLTINSFWVIALYVRRKGIGKSSASTHFVSIFPFISILSSILLRKRHTYLNKQIDTKWVNKQNLLLLFQYYNMG